MKKHLGWFISIALFALSGPQVFGGEDGPALFVIPQRQTSPTPASPKKITPASPLAKATSLTPATPNKPAPAQARIVKTAPALVGPEITVPNPKTPSGEKRVVNRPVTMPSQMPGTIARQADNRILSGAGSGAIGPYRARLELRPNGTFVVTGNIEGSGTWYQRGPMIVMESATSHYEGQLANSTVSGTRTFKDRNGIEPWSFVLSDRALEIRFSVQGK